MSLHIQKVTNLLSDDVFLYVADVNARYNSMYYLGSDGDIPGGPYHPGSVMLFGEYDPAADYRVYSNSCLIIYSKDRSLVPETGENCSLVIIYDNKEYESVRRTVKQMFLEQIMLRDISDEMLDVIRKSCNVQDLLDYGYSILKNPIMLVDVTMKYIASSGAGYVKDEPIWEETIRTGVMPSDYVNAIFDYKKSGDISQDKLLIEDKISKDYMNHDHIASKVTNHVEIIGYLKLLEYNREISDFDIEVFLMLSKYLPFVLNKSNVSQSKISVEENFIKSLMDGVYNDRQHFYGYMNSFGLKFYDNFQIITFACNSVYNVVDRNYFIMKKLDKYFRNHIVVQRENYFMVLYNTRKPDEGARLKDDEGFLAFLREIDCNANISFGFSDLFDIQKYYQQTVFCCSYRKMFRKKEPVLLYESIIEYHMLLNFSDVSDLKYLIHPIILQLKQYDEEHGSNYLETLFAYINHSQNLSATANALFIHYNTLRYRINRIQEITSIDLSNTRQIFLFTISEHILEMQKEVMRNGEESGKEYKYIG